MKALLVLLFILPFNLYAQEESCHHDHGLLNEDLSQLIEWFGANDRQVETAPCKTKSVPSEKKMLDFISQKISRKETDTKTVNGVHFKDENPALIKAFEDFTTLYDAMGNFKQEGQKNIQQEYKINPDCDKVQCALKKIWGENAVKMLYIKLKHNYNTSDLAFMDSARFSKEELDDVLSGLEDIPDHLSPVGRQNQRLARFSEGYSLAINGIGSGTVLANAVIMLFDPWKRETSLSRQYTIFHEISHNMARGLDLMDKNPEWLELSSWVKKGDDWSSEKGACFPSEYSATNPAEDFAEVATTYRYNGNGLKKRCPEKYAFMKKNVFKGIEYTDEKLCLPPSQEQISNVRKQVGKDLLSLLSSKNYSVEEITEHCSDQFNSYPLKQEETASCALQIQLKTSLRPQIKRAMEKFGINETGYQEEFLTKTLIEDFKRDDLFFENVMGQTKPLTDKVNSLVEEEIRKAFSWPIPADKLDGQLRSATRNCGELLFLSKTESEILDCYIADLVKEDKLMKGWGTGFLPTLEVPHFFSKEASEDFNTMSTKTLEVILTRNPQVIEKQQGLKKALLSDLQFHFSDVNRELKQIPRWKEMPPKDFCEATYGKATLWVAIYGLQSKEVSPLLVEKCIKIQSQKNKRFELSPKNLEEFIN